MFLRAAIAYRCRLFPVLRIALNEGVQPGDQAVELVVEFLHGQVVPVLPFFLLPLALGKLQGLFSQPFAALLDLDGIERSHSQPFL